MKIYFASARAPLSGAVLLALGLAGCGGGGNGPSTSPTPTPVAANLTYDKTKYTPNYVATLEQDRANDTSTPPNRVALLRWTRFPLSVYFVRDGDYTTEKQALAVRGFNRWVSATGSDGVTYNLTNSEDNADITVNFGTFTNDADNILGQTFFSYDPSNRVFYKGVNIQIKLTGDTNNDLITASHEFGHALGINGHSPNRTDLMYFTGNDQFSGNITTPDLNTVKTSYDNIFNKNVNTRIAPGSGAVVSASIR